VSWLLEDPELLAGALLVLFGGLGVIYTVAYVALYGGRGRHRKP
jgi:hypothetical protein